MFLYYITDRTQFRGTENARRARLLQKISEAAHCGVDYIQLREKDLAARDLEGLAIAAVQTARGAARNPAILINSRVDVALAAGADGVHLRSTDIAPAEVRSIWHAARIHGPKKPVVAVSCHEVFDVALAAEQLADFAVFAPVFEKRGVDRVAKMSALHEACRCKIPVLALGGVTLENAAACMEAGTAGIAGIRLFQENDIFEVVRRLRG